MSTQTREVYLNVGRRDYMRDYMEGLLMNPCDRCQVLPGFDFFDGYWLCLLCREAYMAEVSSELVHRGSECRVI